MRDWETMTQDEQEKVINHIHHRNWLNQNVDVEYDAYFNKESKFEWWQRQIKKYPC